MHKTSVINAKGGSGKTTTVVNLAGCLAAAGKKVLLIDMDPQASASTWLGVDGSDGGLFRVLSGDQELPSTIRPSTVDGLDVIPSWLGMWQADKILASEPGAETILRYHVNQLPHDWDHLLIDGPPSLGILAWSAMCAAPNILVPCEATMLACQGMANLVQAVKTISQRIDESVHISGVVACRVDARTKHSLGAVDLLNKHFPELLYKTVVRENTRLKEAPGLNQPIHIYDKSSNGAKDYHALAAEFIQRMEGKTDELKVA